MTSMSDHEDPSRLVPAVITGSMYEAEIACAALRAAEIDCFVPNVNSSMINIHIFNLVNPGGAEVIVRAGDLERAREVLRLPKDADEPFINAAKPEPLDDADQLASRAALLSLVVALFPPLAIWVFHLVIRAMKAARSRRPEKPREYGTNLFAAVCFSVVLATVSTLIIWNTIAWMFSDRRF